jgi:hypothetical protein
MKSIKTNPNSAKGPDKGKIVNKLYCILLTRLDVHMAQVESWKNKNIDGFYTKTTQKGGFSKLCVKIKKRCYTDQHSI